MKKILFGLTLLFSLIVGSAAFAAADWQPVDGQKDIYWDNANLQYLVDEKGEKVEGNLVYTRIKAPAHKELVQKLADMQTDENIKQDILTITHTVDNYIYSLDKKEVCFAGRFFINAKDEIILQDNRVSDFIPVPSDKPVVSKVYENLKAQEKAGKIQ